MLKYALLGFLNYQPMTGYDLGALIERSTAHFWHARLSQIYRTLKHLEAEGYVVSHHEVQAARPDRRVYTITEAGRADLLNWLRTPLVELEPFKDTLLLKLFFARPVGKDAILAQLRIQRELHRQLLNTYRTDVAEPINQMRQSGSPLALDALLWDATRRMGEYYVEAAIRWLDETIQRVEAEFPDDDPAGGGSPGDTPPFTP